MTDKIRGKVKFFNEEKGYGFIQPTDGGEDVFVHISAVQDSHYDTLNKDDVVEFVKEKGRNGKIQAEKIRVIS